jgi:hypothetical protein
MTRSQLGTVDRGIMEISDTPTAIGEFQEGSREQCPETPIDPTCLGNRSQWLMLGGPRVGQSVILSADRLGTARHEVSGPPDRRFAVIGCSSLELRT